MKLNRNNYTRKEWRELQLAIKHKIPLEVLAVLAYGGLSAEKVHQIRKNYQQRQREELTWSNEKYLQQLDRFVLPISRRKRSR